MTQLRSAERWRRLALALPWPHGRLLAISVAGIVVLATAHVIDRLTIDADLLRLDLEANLPTWFSSLQFGLAGVASLLLGGSRAPERRLWTAVGVLMLLLSLDELATLHERISAQIGADPAELVVQPLIGLAVIALLLDTAWRTGGVARVLLVAAVGALVLGHLAELATPAPEEGPVAAALKIVEESFEMLLAALVLSAAAARAAALGVIPTSA